MKIVFNEFIIDTYNKDIYLFTSIKKDFLAGFIFSVKESPQINGLWKKEGMENWFKELRGERMRLIKDIKYKVGTIRKHNIMDSIFNWDVNNG